MYQFDENRRIMSGIKVTENAIADAEKNKNTERIRFFPFSVNKLDWEKIVKVTIWR